MTIYKMLLLLVILLLISSCGPKKSKLSSEAVTTAKQETTAVEKSSDAKLSTSSKEKMKMIVNKKYKISKIVTDITYTVMECIKDDVITFMDNHELYADENGTPCDFKNNKDDDKDDIDWKRWELVEKENGLHIRLYESEETKLSRSDLYKIIRLTEDEFAFDVLVFSTFN